jgi:dienelactone hydrolase
MLSFDKKKAAEPAAEKVPFPGLTEHLAQARVSRKNIRQSVRRLLSQLETEAANRRQGWFKPDLSSLQGYEASLGKYRQDLASVLGWPLNLEGRPETLNQVDEVFRTDQVIVERLRLQGVSGVEAAGILLRPNKVNERFPLVILLHGGNCTPEGLMEKSTTYHHAHERLLAGGCAVFVPQLLSWPPEPDAPLKRHSLDASLKRYGSSLAAVEISNLLGFIDYFRRSELIKPTSIGLAGFSYGAFLALFTGALDPRIKVVAASGYLSALASYVLDEAGWSGFSYFFSDAEIAALFCPRPLYMEIGANDPVLKKTVAETEAARIMDWYQKIGKPSSFDFQVFEGGHEFLPLEKGVQFLLRALA